MQNKYCLEIDCTESDIKVLVQILNIEIDKNFNWKYKLDLEKNVFSYWVLEEEKDKYFDYINYFLDLLEKKYDNLNKIGINKSDITIWRYYKYFEQCNMEFEPNDMYRLWKNDISLCVSCVDMSGDSNIHIWEYKVKKDDWI